MRASMSCDLIARDAAMLMLPLCLCSVPTGRDYASNIVTELHVVDRPAGDGDGPGGRL
jgi:hypothetical protein